MLPGGLNIIGIFAMAPPAVMTTVQNRLKLVSYLLYQKIGHCRMITNEINKYSGTSFGRSLYWTVTSILQRKFGVMFRQYPLYVPFNSTNKIF